MMAVKLGLAVAGPVSIVAFALLVSSATSNLVAYIALTVSVMFMGISMWMLGWILEKDCGPRAMQEIAEPIREGSEGFFMT